MVNDETLAANLMERDVISSEIIAVIEVSKKVNKIITKKKCSPEKSATNYFDGNFAIYNPA